MECRKGLRWKNVIGGKSEFESDIDKKKREKSKPKRSKSTDSSKSEKKDKKDKKKDKKDKKDKDKSKSVTAVEDIGEEDVGVSVNCIKFIPSFHRDNLFVSVDDGATMKVWDSDNGNLVAEEPRFSNGSM
jgi:sRNA-binding protein